MRYYALSNCEETIKNIKEFVIRRNETGELFMLSFEDKDLDFIENNSEVARFIDKKRRLYELKNGKAVYSGTKINSSPNRWFRHFIRLYKAIHKEQDRIAGCLKSEAETGIKCRGIPLGKYRPFWFADRENGTAFPFRFKKSKGSEKQPLVIFFSGAGALGTDNIKPYFEFTPMRMKLKKYNCNILIPQAVKGVNFGSSYEGFNNGMSRYAASVKALAERLIKDNNIDESRIYVFGTSFGGFCTWRSAYLFPDFYAAALPVMGGFDSSVDFEKSQYTDFERLINLPIWAAHSSDDNNVRIDNDDYAVSRLKELGGNIKYTRWDKYGHAMASRFYRNEKWCEWMFKQKK